MRLTWAETKTCLNWGIVYTIRLVFGEVKIKMGNLIEYKASNLLGLTWTFTGCTRIPIIRIFYRWNWIKSS